MFGQSFQGIFLKSYFNLKWRLWNSYIYLILKYFSKHSQIKLHEKLHFFKQNFFLNLILTISRTFQENHSSNLIVHLNFLPLSIQDSFKSRIITRRKNRHTWFTPQLFSKKIRLFFGSQKEKNKKNLKSKNQINYKEKAVAAKRGIIIRTVEENDFYLFWSPESLKWEKHKYHRLWTAYF